MSLEKVSLIELANLCHNGNVEALEEWKRRWLADFPNMGRVEDVERD